jgi:hypothetical protein
MAPAGYSGTPLARKLGIKAGSSLLLSGAPKGFRGELVGLPDAVRITTQAGTDPKHAPDLIVWFIGSRRELEGGIGRMAAVMGQGLWVAWPKKSSGIRTDVTEDTIRAAGLAHGLVDYKVCAINEIWSGLKFARRRSLTMKA